MPMPILKPNGIYLCVWPGGQEEQVRVLKFIEPQWFVDFLAKSYVYVERLALIPADRVAGETDPGYDTYIPVRQCVRRNWLRPIGRATR